MFRGLFARRRALVFADGFYEWVADGAGGRKTPYYLRMRDGSPFAFAALWDRTPGEVPIESTTLVTTAPNVLVAPLHDRMPVILPRDAYEAWLDPRVGDALWLLELLVPYDATAMEAYPVSLRVSETVIPHFLRSLATRTLAPGRLLQAPARQSPLKSRPRCGS
jgi:putative SOS response-associated peptidase YedK